MPTICKKGVDRDRICNGPIGHLGSAVTDVLTREGHDVIRLAINDDDDASRTRQTV